MLNIRNIMSHEDKKLTEIVNSLKARLHETDDFIKMSVLKKDYIALDYYQTVRKTIKSDLNIIESIIDSK